MATASESTRLTGWLGFIVAYSFAGDRPAHCVDSDAPRGSTGVAPQSKLGPLSQRWDRADLADRDSPPALGSSLSSQIQTCVQEVSHEFGSGPGELEAVPRKGVGGVGQVDRRRSRCDRRT